MDVSTLRCLVVFRLGPYRLGIPVQWVERTVRAVEPMPLPGAPECVRGAVNYHGELLPVYEVRLRLGLTPRELRRTDHLVIVQTARRRLALLIGPDIELLESPEAELVAPEEFSAASSATASVMKDADSIILIQDVDRFLSPEEEQALSAALAP